MVGRTANCCYYVEDPRVLIAWPDEGTLDTAETATENVDFQMDHFRSVGAPGIVMIFFDRMSGQDRGARQVYTSRVTENWSLGIALVGGSLLSRAMSAFFIGLSKPHVPTRLFATEAAAASWIGQVLGRR
ncbi:MAG: hypothetical protein O2930_13100 [Acidobacteria bacterium]|nr:hypothetical protein [Acidobacteriota bacterium]